jgi:hypothetical protein
LVVQGAVLALCTTLFQISNAEYEWFDRVWLSFVLVCILWFRFGLTGTTSGAAAVVCRFFSLHLTFISAGS